MSQSTQPTASLSQPHARYRAAGLLALMVFALGMLLAPAELYPGDPYAWFLEARSIVHDGRLSVPEDKAAYGESGQFFARNPQNGLLYSKYGLGSSITVLPAFAVARAMGIDSGRPLLAILNLQYALMAAAMAAALIALASRLTTSNVVAGIFVLLCLYSTFFCQYLRAHTMELPLCLYFSLWFLALTEDRRGIAMEVLLWCALAMLVLSRPVFVLLVPVTSAGLLIRSRMPWHRPVGRLLRVVMPGVLVVLLLGIVNQVKFGSWSDVGYGQWRPGENVPAIGNGWNLFEAMVDPQFSLLIMFPVLLFALMRWRKFLSISPFAGTTAMVSFIVVGGAYLLTPNWRGEWSEGPRYLLFALPVLSLPVVLLLDELRDGRERLRRAALVSAMVIIFGGMAANQYAILTRPFLAWYRILTPLGVVDRRIGGLTPVLPRGVLLVQLHRAIEAPRAHPILESARDRLPPEKVPAYVRIVALESAPSNLFWFGH